jgi:hypothetical protein
MTTKEVNMSNTKHTPGPWRHYHGKLRPQFPNLIHEIVDKNGEAIVKWGGFDGVDLPKKQIAANARLMAAAPELLEACEAAYASLGFPINNESLNRVTNQLANAIAKAKR